MSKCPPSDFPDGASYQTNCPFATHAWRAPAWIPVVPAAAYVIGKSVWSAIKRKALADHLRAHPQAAQASPALPAALTTTSADQ